MLQTETVPQTLTENPPFYILLIILVLFFFIIALCVCFRLQKKSISKSKTAAKEMEDKILFLTNIVHELRTPLIMIYNPLKELLIKRNVDNKDYERIKGIYNQVNKMTSMINLILNGSRNKTSKKDLIPETIDLNSWINEILNDYDLSFSDDGHRFVFLPDPKILSTRIDKSIIETGLSNLLNNAVKYSPKGSVITVFTHKEGERISITVQDKGRGFYCDSEDLFRKDYRERPDDCLQGYGLGLTYVRFLMELAEGTVTASHNEDGIGSSFCMTFPARLQK